MKEEKALYITHEEKLLLEFFLGQKKELLKSLTKQFADDNEYCQKLQEDLDRVDNLAMKLNNV